jgi:hypothetical protein
VPPKKRKKESEREKEYAIFKQELVEIEVIKYVNFKI